MKQRRHLVRDIALYVLISLLICAALIAAALSKLPEALIFRWFGSFLFTAGVFGFLIEKSRTFWNRQLFWVLTGSFFIIHCGVLALTLNHVQDFPKIFWIIVPETLLLRQVVKIVFRHRTKRPTSNHKLTNL